MATNQCVSCSWCPSDCTHSGNPYDPSKVTISSLQRNAELIALGKSIGLTHTSNKLKKHKASNKNTFTHKDYVLAMQWAKQRLCLEMGFKWAQKDCPQGAQNNACCGSKQNCCKDSPWGCVFTQSQCDLVSTAYAAIRPESDLRKTARRCLDGTCKKGTSRALRDARWVYGTEPSFCEQVNGRSSSYWDVRRACESSAHCTWSKAQTAKKGSSAAAEQAWRKNKKNISADTRTLTHLSEQRFGGEACRRRQTPTGDAYTPSVEYSTFGYSALEPSDVAIAHGSLYQSVSNRDACTASGGYWNQGDACNPMPHCVSTPYPKHTYYCSLPLLGVPKQQWTGDINRKCGPDQQEQCVGVEDLNPARKGQYKKACESVRLQNASGDSFAGQWDTNTNSCRVPVWPGTVGNKGGTKRGKSKTGTPPSLFVQCIEQGGVLVRVPGHGKLPDMEWRPVWDYTNKDNKTKTIHDCVRTNHIARRICEIPATRKVSSEDTPCRKVEDKKGFYRDNLHVPPMQWNAYAADPLALNPINTSTNTIDGWEGHNIECWEGHNHDNCYYPDENCTNTTNTNVHKTNCPHKPTTLAVLEDAPYTPISLGAKGHSSWKANLGWECHGTRAYCKKNEVSWESQPSGVSNKGGSSKTKPNKGHGCYLTEGQKISEFLFSKTLTRDFNRDVTDVYESHYASCKRNGGSGFVCGAWGGLTAVAGTIEFVGDAVADIATSAWDGIKDIF
jgi:hypothetical protein